MFSQNAHWSTNNSHLILQSTRTLPDAFQTAHGSFVAWGRNGDFFTCNPREILKNRICKQFAEIFFFYCNATVSSKKQCICQCILVPVLNFQSSLLESLYNTGFSMFFIVFICFSVIPSQQIVSTLRTTMVVTFISGPQTWWRPTTQEEVKKCVAVELWVWKVLPSSRAMQDQATGITVFADLIHILLHYLLAT